MRANRLAVCGIAPWNELPLAESRHALSAGKGSRDHAGGVPHGADAGRVVCAAQPDVCAAGQESAHMFALLLPMGRCADATEPDANLTPWLTAVASSGPRRRGTR
jgi:hypothetical protein